MKNTAYIVISCLSALVLASCVKDDLYNTPHPDKGALVVTADFSERTETLSRIPTFFLLTEKLVMPIPLSCSIILSCFRQGCISWLRTMSLQECRSRIMSCRWMCCRMVR